MTGPDAPAAPVRPAILVQGAMPNAGDLIKQRPPTAGALDLARPRADITIRKP